jgi:3-hydroxyisobutyrate dehydrogenase-like beta-hydroxyacid dehydrogenase
MNKKKIGLIGLGLVGSAVSDRLIGSGFEVAGYDVRADAPDGLTICSGPGEVLSLCERVILCLPTSEVVAEVVNESREHFRSGQIVIDTGTGSPKQMEQIHNDLKGQGVCYLEATIAGSSHLLRNKKAPLFTAGDKSIIDEQRDLFNSLTEKSFYLGAFGKASRFKLVHNLLIGLNRAVLAEGLQFAESLGFDSQESLSILKETTASSGVMYTKGERMVVRDYEEPQALLSQHMKDVKLILAESEKSGAIVPLSALHKELLEAVEMMGLGSVDNSAIMEAFNPES